MTTTQIILIFLAIAAILWGLMTVVKSVRKNNAIKPIPPSENLLENDTETTKDGLPIVPRHERAHPQNIELSANEMPNTDVQVTGFNNTPISTLTSEPSTFDTARQRAMDADTSISQEMTETVYSIDKDNPVQSQASYPTTTTNTLLAKNDEPDAFSALASATETLTPVVQTGDETQLKANTFTEDSPILDTHIQAQIDQDQNSPLNNAEQNINISLFPNSQFERILGKDLLNLLDKYGLKYGAMNMFHRYENKDGTGLLWFSMMQVDEDGVTPFDLNRLPTQSLKGLVLFLSLPHPKAVQGFDSMISVAGMLAQDLGSSLYDHDGEPISRDSIQYMRELATDYGKNRWQ